MVAPVFLIAGINSHLTVTGAGKTLLESQSSADSGACVCLPEKKKENRIVKEEISCLLLFLSPNPSLVLGFQWSSLMLVCFALTVRAPLVNPTPFISSLFLLQANQVS